MARLGELCKIQSGGTPSRSNKNYWSNGTIPWVKISDIKGKYLDTTEEFITSIGLECSSAKIFPAGTILYTIFATLGEVCILDIDAATNQAIAGIQIESDRIDRDYLYHYLSSLKQTVNNIGRGVAQNNINMKILRDFKIPLPSLDEQRRIASVLDKVSSLIAKRRQQLDKLDELVKARFVELLGFDVPTVKLGDVCRMINGDRGKNYPSGNDFVECGVPFVNAGHLKNRRVDFCDMNYITEEKYELLTQGKMQAGDILYCLRGSLGKHGLVDFERGAVASSLVILRCNKDKMLPEFLLYALETPEIELQLKIANNGSSQPNLSAASVKSYDIKLPEIERQKMFVSFVAQVDKSKLAIQKSLEKLETLKKALMQEYFG